MSNERLRKMNFLISETNETYLRFPEYYGIPDSVMQIMYSMRFTGQPCTQSEIVSMTGISKKTINSAVEKMTADGLLRRLPAKGRSVPFELTEKGLELAEKTVDHVIEIENRILDSWSKEDQDAYMRLLKKYADDLKRETAQFTAGGGKQ